MIKIVPAYQGMADYIQAARSNPESEWGRLWNACVIDRYWDQWAAGEHNEARTRQELSRPVQDVDGLETAVKALAESGVEALVKAAYEDIYPRLPYHTDEAAICIMASATLDLAVVGACIGANTLLTINPNKAGWAQWVKYVLAHERHHSAWGYHYYYIQQGTRHDLLIALISEGSADSFAHLVSPDFSPQWIHSLSAQEEARQWQNMLPLLDTPDEGDRLYRRFFFGDPANSTPAFTGYTIGFQIVQQYLRSHPHEQVADWTVKDPEALFKESGYPAG
jgi:hypothetical protein